MKTEYDVLIIGAGPGGAMAAKTAAEQGLSVLMVEKRPAIGTPVRCAEGVGKELLHEFIEPDPAWIAADIERATIVGPDGTSMSLEAQRAGNEVGYILDRKVFDRALVWQAAEAGAEVQVKTRAIAPIIEDGFVRGARLQGYGTTTDVRAKVVIAADGVESKFARWCGVDTAVPVNEIETCAQYLLTDIDIDESATVFYLGNEVAPEGYAWVFPKGKRTANVGLGISGKKNLPGNRPIDYLNRFVKKNFPNGKTIECIVGGVSVCMPLASTVSDGLMIVGDAARISDPLTGGGIYNAMYSGRLAAQVAIECIKRGDCSRAALAAYDQQWRVSTMGKALDRNYKIKEYFIRQSDEKLNALAHSFKKINMEKFSTLELIKELIKHNPKLLFELKTLRDSLNS
jgi:digeranylgeranylglycerophospholipid reductase